MHVFEIRAKRHPAANKPDTILFYDEDREKAISFMRKYDKENGFSLKTKDGTFTIATLLLVERTLTGTTISSTPYHMIFDVYGKRIDVKE